MRQAAGGEEGAVPGVYGVCVRCGGDGGYGNIGCAEELPQCDVPVGGVLVVCDVM